MAPAPTPRRENREALVAFGSNQRGRFSAVPAAIEHAVEELAKYVTVRAVSSMYRTPPAGGPPGQDDFYNAAAVVLTSFSPRQLLETMKSIEQGMGRVAGDVWGPRCIDLDLIFFAEQVIPAEAITVEEAASSGVHAGDELSLILPHPRMAWRGFVLDPALEVAANWRHPRLNQTVRQLHHRLVTANSCGLASRRPDWLRQVNASISTAGDCLPLVLNPEPAAELRMVVVDADTARTKAYWDRGVPAIAVVTPEQAVAELRAVR